mgnify:CR=1 FL=1
MIKQPVLITKASGETVAYDQQKLIASLERSGAGVPDISVILEDIDKRVYPGISTSKIYNRAYALLKKRSIKAAQKYKLKKALFELGPTGFPFEQFVSRLFEYQGYKVRVGVQVKGNCLEHEVDVVATRNDSHYMVECKFHREQGRTSDVKVPLYIHSRFRDIERACKKLEDHNLIYHTGWIVTNTRFTSEALKYAKCAGIKLMSWDYPKHGSLKERMDISGIYPLTCLASLNKMEKRLLIENEMVSCSDLIKTPTLFKKLGFSERKIKRIIEEATLACETE